MNDLASAFRFGVAVLGAGRSRRMGQSKLLLPWKGTSVIGHLIRVWRGTGASQIAVVCAGDQPDVINELDRLGFDAGSRILNPNPDLGMFSSIQCAARWSGWKTGLTHWVIALGDQPHLRQRTLATLCAFAAAHIGHICQPAYRGRAAHPVILPRNDFQELASAEAHDLKAFLARRNVLRCEVEDPGLVCDMDTPEDYQRLSGADSAV